MEKVREFTTKVYTEETESCWYDEVKIFVKIETGLFKKKLYGYVYISEVDEDFVYWALTQDEEDAKGLSDDQWAETVIGDMKEDIETHVKRHGYACDGYADYCANWVSDAVLGVA